jgi:hypothetical protein
MNKDKEVILGYLKWLANRLSSSMATQLNGADVDEYLEQQVDSVDLADVGERNAAKIWGIMADPSINKKTYDRLAEVYNDICDPVNKGNLPIRIDVNYV